MPRHCLDPRLLLYSKVAQLGAQVEQLFAIAGRERSHVIVFDDLVADPLARLPAAPSISFDVDYDGQTRFEPRYESRMYRYRWLQRMLFVPATRGGKMMETLQRRTRKYNPDGSKRPSLIKRVTRWNKIPASPVPLTPPTADAVRETLRPDVALLSRLLGRDLSAWLDG